MDRNPQSVVCLSVIAGAVFLVGYLVGFDRGRFADPPPAPPDRTRVVISPAGCDGASPFFPFIVFPPANQNLLYHPEPAPLVPDGVEL